MDRIDAMQVFAATPDDGSRAGASRRLGRAPAAVERLPRRAGVGARRARRHAAVWRSMGGNASVTAFGRDAA
jgi:hypothetical protein